MTSANGSSPSSSSAAFSVAPRLSGDGIGILATGSYVPEEIVTNDDIAALVPTSDEWIQKHLGIKERRHAAPNEQSSDLAVNAAKNALQKAGLKETDLDAIIVGLGNGDVASPATACYVQKKLGAQCLAFDIRAACAGFLVGLELARGMVGNGSHQNVLVIGVDVVSRTRIDWTDRTLPAIFGDGAGCAIIGRTSSSASNLASVDDTAAAMGEPSSGFISAYFNTDGKSAHYVGIDAGGSVEPLSKAAIENKSHLLHMLGHEVWEHATRSLPDAIRRVLKDADAEASDLDFVVTHQANLRLIEAVLDDVGVPMSKTYTTVEKYANTLVASLPITLDEAVRAGHIKEGDLVLLTAIGAGMTWGAHLIRF
ncbi:MAG: ketoacyl-ACP synthase III [Deltaproteobacteria bacterium]|nr:ketoacyl-ACP synthase III [Deltaproteobacteria bacterium]